jgi:hypothetical protein
LKRLLLDIVHEPIKSGPGAFVPEPQRRSGP